MIRRRDTVAFMQANTCQNLRHARRGYVGRLAKHDQSTINTEHFESGLIVLVTGEDQRLISILLVEIQHSALLLHDSDEPYPVR